MEEDLFMDPMPSDVDYGLGLLPNDPPVPVNPVANIESEMMVKYGITVDFMKQYVEFAQDRTPVDIMHEKLMLPVGRMDRDIMQRLVSDAIDALRKYDAVKETRRALFVQEFTRLKVLKDAAVLQSEKTEYQKLMTKVVTDYSSFTSTGCKARCKLFRLAQLEPIDAAAFHSDMARYIHAWTVARISINFPEQAAKLI